MQTVILEAQSVPKAGKKSKTSTQVIPYVPNTQRNATIVLQKKQKKKRNHKKKNSRQFTPTDKFTSALLYPSLVGPFRQPRTGSPRTGLAMDVTRTQMIGSATNVIQGAQLGTIFSGVVGSQWSALTSGTALGTPASIVPTVQFPVPNQMADINVVSAEILIYYTGPPLTVQGELIMGSCIGIANTATYDSVYYLPGTIHLAVSELMKAPLRVALTKISPVADEFVAVGTGNADCSQPFFFTSGLPTGGTLAFQITRNFEYRSSTTPSNVIPFEIAGNSLSSDLFSFGDASAEVGRMPLAISEATPKEDGIYATSGMKQLLVGMGVSALSGGVALVTNYVRNHMTRVRQNHRINIMRDFPNEEF